MSSQMSLRDQAGVRALPGNDQCAGMFVLVCVCVCARIHFEFPLLIFLFSKIVLRKILSGPVYPLERYFVWNAVVSIDRWVFILVSFDPLL